MAFFVWSDELSVEHTEIDDDHRKLVTLVDDLYLALEEGRGKERAAAVLEQLISETRAHFQREHDIMLRADYEARAGHEHEHAKLLREIAELRRKFDAGDTVLTIQVSVFLRDWLFKHIQEVDKPMVDALRAARR